MTATPPPPPPTSSGEVQEKAPVVAWLIPLAGLLAVIGVFTPWFKPEVSATAPNGPSRTVSVDDALYSWKDGKIGLIAPIILVILAIGVIGMLTGRKVSRFERGSNGPVVNAARGAIIAGAVSIVATVIAWFLLPSQYSFVDGGKKYSWDDYIDALKGVGLKDVSIGHGPQIGYWLTAVAGALAIVGGVLMLVMRQKPQAVAGSFAAPPAGPAYGPPPSAPAQAPSAPAQAPSFEKQPPAMGEQPPSQ